MSLVQFMAVGKASAAAKLRPGERSGEKTPAAGVGETPAFDSTFAAVQRKRSAKPETPEQQVRKLDKPERKRANHHPTEANDKSSRETTAASDSTAAASAESADGAEHDKAPADSGDAEKHNTEKSPDGSEITVSAEQRVQGGQGCHNVAVTPQDPSGTAGGDASVPASSQSTELADARQTAIPTKSKQAPKPAAGNAPTTPPSDQNAKDADAEALDANASKDGSEKQPILPALAGRGSKAHEKTTHAAHVNAEAADTAQDAAPAVPQAPADGSLAQALASAAESVPTQLSAKDGESAPGADAGLTQIDGHGRPGGSDAAHAEVAPAAQDSPRAEGSETFDQVVLGLKGKLDARTGKAEIRLDPPNLGTVRVSVTLANGQLTAEFQSASNVVRDLLNSNLDKLKTTLQGQGVTVDRLAVDAPPTLPDAGGGQNPQASFGSATHDGRSAGQFQEGRPGQQRSAGEGFARMFTQAQEAPLDLVA